MQGNLILRGDQSLLANGVWSMDCANWAVARKLHSAGGSSSGATEPTRVDAHAPQLRRKLVEARVDLRQCRAALSAAETQRDTSRALLTECQTQLDEARGNLRKPSSLCTY